MDPDDVIEQQFFEETCTYVGRAYLDGALEVVLPERLELESFEPIEYNDKKSAPWLSLKKDAKPPKEGSSPRRDDTDDADTPRSSRSKKSGKRKDKKKKKKSTNYKIGLFS